ncbi:MAG TPA: nucleotidyltransferase domain-containing protein [Pseudomonas xinjiangensis]|uniref:Nucleotidyltransferase domain-containing protein n=2 Tax=root TaxID=1 RepID=A0A7V1BP54_9GAMM|nr:nucleotidyltransferase domain-containing protein [Halopseudomonas xinjiangensis]HEC48605.1 nucleotidyltransferase domain-containing protein [Halopseudomonas xinjiangensis]
MNLQPALDELHAAFPDLSAVYLFGSRATGDAGPGSDLDLAILAGTAPGPVDLWDLSSRLAGIVGCPVDLLDLLTASTVMQYRVITTGQRLWSRGSEAPLYESFILSEKTDLDEARAGILQDICDTGRIYAG